MTDALWVFAAVCLSIPAWFAGYWHGRLKEMEAVKKRGEAT